MADKEIIIAAGKRVVQLEAAALHGIEMSVNEQFAEAVESILAAEGRVVVSGIGKSALVAQKMVATFNSTGTPALFMHAADAIHGDLGMVQQSDVVMIISKSGDSPEIKVLVPLVKSFGNTLIGIVGNRQGYLAQHSDIVLDTTVSQEACPNNLAPTSSSTAQMVMGDALAVSLMEMKGFRPDDFAKFHPGGALGKKLYLKVIDMVADGENPQVSMSSNIREVIMEITSKRLGAAAVLGKTGEIVGIITDGDIRRMIEKYHEIGNLTAGDIMGQNPKTIQKDALAAEALELMKNNNINQLIVLEGANYLGIVHLQDLVKEGII